MNMKVLFLSVVASIMLVGCGSNPTQETKAAQETVTKAQEVVSNAEQDARIKAEALAAEQARAKAAADAAAAEAAARAAAAAAAAIPTQRSVYFGFDVYSVNQDSQQMLNMHAQAINRSQTRVLIQGNADERGSNEYNLALGQKRAEAVKHALVLLGVNESQIEAVSLGEEKPRDPGHNEAAWTENRRADILYNGEY